jgi:hypothetical protein
MGSPIGPGAGVVNDGPCGGDPAVTGQPAEAERETVRTPLFPPVSSNGFASSAVTIGDRAFFVARFRVGSPGAVHERGALEAEPSSASGPRKPEAIITHP